jgi:hypothetical protein
VVAWLGMSEVADLFSYWGEAPPVHETGAMYAFRYRPNFTKSNTDADAVRALLADVEAR